MSSNNCFESYISSIGKRFQAFKTMSTNTVDIAELISNYDKLKNQSVFTTLTETKFLNEEIEYFFYESANNKGILTKKERVDSNSISSIRHKNFVEILGHIIDLFNFENDKVLGNLTEIFPVDDGSIGLGSFDSDYIDKCYSSDLKPLDDYKSFITFAYEANGNRYLYDKFENVYFYAHDHCRDDLQILKNVPEYTFYKVENISNLDDFIGYFFSYFLLPDNSKQVQINRMR